MDEKQYQEQFKDEPCLESGRTQWKPDTRAGAALQYAHDIRKFEIELYWKRAAYFWAFIAASFAGYGLASSGATQRVWLTVLFSSLGLVFSFTWYLVNRGSKFWQNNWERHVDFLENMTVGPLYKIVARGSESNVLTDAGPFSVSRLNQMLSVFVAAVWVILFIKSIGPFDLDADIDWYKTGIFILTICTLVTLWRLGKIKLHDPSTEMEFRTTGISTKADEVELTNSHPLSNEENSNTTPQ
jgi:hypothetical protein